MYEKLVCRYERCHIREKRFEDVVAAVKDILKT